MLRSVPLDKKAMETFILLQLDFCFFFKNIYPQVFSFPVVGITCKSLKLLSMHTISTHYMFQHWHISLVSISFYEIEERLPLAAIADFNFIL